MPDFSLGRVYAVRNTVNAKVYVGSTVRTLAQRMADHRRVAIDDHRPLYVAMRELGVDKFFVELIVDCPCDRRETLNREEGKHIRDLNTIKPNGYNSLIAGRTKAECYTDHKEENNAKSRAYNEAHKEERKTNDRAYQLANVEVLKAYRKAYNIANAEVVKAKQRAYKLANAEALNVNRRAYNLANAETIKAKARERYAAAKAKKIAELAA